MLIGEVMNAKRDRDLIREELVKGLRNLTGLPDEIRAYLIADEEATKAFHLAWEEYHR